MMAPDYKKFALWAVEHGSWMGCDLDGGDIQEKAIECGIIKMVEYDPAIHGLNEFDLEKGAPWCELVDP